MLLCCLSVKSQTVEIVNIGIDDGKVNMLFNIVDTLVGRYYTVRVYSSKDNYLNPLKELSGDVGMEVSPGFGKEIVWDAAKELGSSYDGELSLEIRARVYIPFINVDSFSDIETITRKRKRNITWTGGRASNVLNFDLYREDEKIITFSNVANVGHYLLELPVHTKPGKGYYFIISDSKNKDEVVRTSEFKVKRKTPLLLKKIPILSLGLAAYILFEPEEDNTLPAPPSNPPIN